MSSIIGFQKSIDEIEIIEEIEKLLEEEKRLKLSAQQTSQLQNSYYTYLSTLLSQKQQYEERSESNASNILSQNSSESAYLLCEPKQLDFYSNQKKIIQSLMGDHNFQQNQNESPKLVQKPKLLDRALSPIRFPETKAVQTESQTIDENLDMKALINQLKQVIKSVTQVNSSSIMTSNNANDVKCLTQCTQTCCSTIEKSTQYKFNIECKTFGTQTETVNCEKESQTFLIKEKSNNRSTQTDLLTDEEKSCNSYEFSVGEIPYFCDLSDNSSYC